MADHVKKLRFIKALHTLIWAFFVACILAIPWAAWRGAFRLVLWCNGLMAFELLMLALNRIKCPLTAVAARYTDDRRDNFDIYLPLWLARYNKEIFGTLFVLCDLYALARWTGWM